MGQEFFIKSDGLESKVRQLLPSQGGLGAGFDLSASTQIVPIVDLTESAEGSNVRADLQTAFSFGNITSFDISDSTTTIINNTGYYKVQGVITAQTSTSANVDNKFRITDGATTKTLFGSFATSTTNVDIITIPFNFVVLLLSLIHI